MADSSYQRVRKALDQARAQGASDADLIRTLTDTLTPAQLADLHKQAILSDNLTMEGAIAKAFMRRAEPSGATVSSTPGSSRLTHGTTDLTHTLGTLPVETKKASPKQTAREVEVEKNKQKVHRDIYNGGRQT